MIYYFLLVAIILFPFWVLYKRFRSFDRNLKIDLEKKGFILKNITTPNLFARCPFKDFERYNFHYSTTFLGVKGEDVFYRIVSFEDKKGYTYKLCVEITTRMFKVYSINWEKEFPPLSVE